VPAGKRNDNSKYEIERRKSVTGDGDRLNAGLEVGVKVYYM